MRLGFRSEASAQHLEMARRLGYPVIELHWHAGTRGVEAEIAERLTASGIGVSALLTGEEPTPSQLRKDLEATARFGARAFVSHLRPIATDGRSAQEQFRETFGPAADYAEQLGVRLAIHSCGLAPADWDAMFSLVPKLGLKYDPSFSYQAGRNYLAEVVAYGSRIVHVHVKDERFMGRQTDFSHGLLHFSYSPAGTGDIHWGSIIALLYEVGYQGDLAIETHSQFWNQHLAWDLLLSKRHLEQYLIPEAGMV